LDITANSKDWQELEALVNRARRPLGGIRRMTPEELSRLDVLYRKTTMHLAQVTSRTKDPALIRYLNSLTAAAHSVIYLPPKQPALKGALQFVLTGFPRAFARTWRYHAVAALILFLGLAIGYIAVARDNAAAYALMPAEEFRQPGATPEQLLQGLRDGRDQSDGTKFAFASFLFSNNLRVGLLSLATGMLAAIPTIILLIYNGMLLGAYTAVHYGSDIQVEWWAWVLPHGVTEITAIVLCGGAGLQLGAAVVRPGILSRTHRLKLAGGEAVRVVLGIALMLTAAALIEGYLRQSHLPTAARFAVFAGATALFWIAYFGRGFVRTAGVRPGRVRAS